MIAGNWRGGRLGRRGPADQARLAWPWGLAVDAVGNVFVADEGIHRVRPIDAASGIIETVAGTGVEGGSGDGGPANEAQLAWPAGVAIDMAGNIFVAERGIHRVRRIDAASGIIETVAGPACGLLGGRRPGRPGAAGRSSGTWRWTRAATCSWRIRGTTGCAGSTAVSGMIETVAGTGVEGGSGDGGPANEAQLAWPAGLAIDAAGISSWWTEATTTSA